MAKKNLIEYKGKVYDVCCLNFYYNVNWCKSTDQIS
jgi:hypothetical protein